MKHLRPTQCGISRWGFAGILSGMLLCEPALVHAQPVSRLESISQEQAQKAQSLRPPSTGKLEGLVLKAESIFLVDPAGFYPYFESVHQGGGLTFGAGYRKYFGDNTFWDVKGLWSVLNYKLVEGAVISRDHLNKRLAFGTR